MAIRRKRAQQGGFVLFDVLYADGTRSSNRKVPGEALAGPDGDAPARAVIEAQDREIALASGRPRRGIASVVRATAPPPRARSR